MKRRDDLVWKTKSEKRIKYILLLGIRFVETCMSSIIPSIIGIILIFMNPGGKIMDLMCTVSFVIFCAFNCFFWMRYSKKRSKRVEFYITNGIVYFLYFLITLVVYKFTGPFFYTMAFSNLRGLEMFGLTTKMSYIVTHLIVLALMVASECFSRFYYRKLDEWMASNGADAVEIKPWTHTTPEKNNDKVRILTVDEMQEEMEREKIEGSIAMKKMFDSTETDASDESMVKGRGEKIEFVKGDYSGDDHREENSDIENYSSENLWNKDIYSGRTAETPDENDLYNCSLNRHFSLWDVVKFKREQSKIKYKSIYGKRLRHRDIPIVDYEEEDEKITEDDMYDVNEGLWDKNFYHGRDKDKPVKKSYAFGVEQDEIPVNNFDKYDSDSLWDNVKQGRQ